ncbi:unnamed protein product (macronuclear) [Paramecium tetraurelia]|uniref:Tubulin-tyrosine ligase family protein n=1 Tax=Paramecium tetraurelia TaxID=5888 RepID=A0DAG9_PARTE|nr:uncharacterized protein GSPATT00014943001 [Paramecium tetraurelia]CAK80036.1 unnamed protein product [Paramecium tetraurelia]|eukprot:XP_001447433.1 hypothetical protein (macronuclear) [Paramecium tetraurelia strain d4-2]
MLQSFLLSLASGIVLFIVYMYHRANLSEGSANYRYYNEAVKGMSRWLEQTVDLTQSHFQPCKNCGYEIALVHDNFYCLRSDLFKLLHPEVVVQDQMVLRDYGGQDLARKIIQQNMYDALPSFVQTRQIEIGYHQTPLETSVVYPYAKNYFRTHTFGKQAGCIFQKYFHVPGQEEIALKSNQSTHFHNYIDNLKQENKSTTCIKDASYEKPTFRMWLKEECENFFEIINTKQYKDKLENEGIQYIYKTNRHLGNGILLLDYQNEKIIRSWYKDSLGCGRNLSQVNNSRVPQESLLIFKGHKMEFRSYFQIASTNPPILYGYKKALIKQCALKFDLLDFTKEAHVCNTAVTKTHKQTTGQEQDDDLYIDWNLEELQDILLQQGKIKSRNWLNEELYPQIMRKITHLFFSVEKYLLKDSRVGEFFGVDFILDDDLNLWIFECNRNPNFLAVTEGRKEKFGKLIPDMLEIQMQLVRSRYKRIRDFMYNTLLPAIKARQFQQQQEKLKEEFLQLMKDRFEPEYKLSTSNLAELAYIGDGQFNGYIKKECLESSRVLKK